MEGLLKLFLKRNFFNSEKDFFEIFLKEIFFCLLKIKKCIDISSIQFEITNFGGDEKQLLLIVAKETRVNLYVYYNTKSRN